MPKFLKLSKFLSIATIAISTTMLFNASKTFASCNWDENSNPPKEISSQLNEKELLTSLKQEEKEWLPKYEEYVRELKEPFFEKAIDYKKRHQNEEGMSQEEEEKIIKNFEKKFGKYKITADEIRSAIKQISNGKKLDEEGINLVEELLTLVKVTFLEAGGGYSLPDNVKLRGGFVVFNGCRGTKHGKMNDTAVLRSFLTATMLENYRKHGTLYPKDSTAPISNSKGTFVILGIKPDKSIKLSEEEKKAAENLPYMLSEIETVPATGRNIGNKETANQIYDKYPSATNFHAATISVAEKMREIAKKHGLPRVEFLRISDQTSDSWGPKHVLPCLIMNKDDKQAIEFAKNCWVPFAKYRQDVQCQKIQGREPVLAKKDDELYCRRVPLTTKEGITTTLNWDVTDNIITQYAAMDENILYHKALMDSLAILRYFKANPDVANVVLEPIYLEINNECVVCALKIAVNISGENIKNLTKGSLVISRADLPAQCLKLEGKIKEIDNNYQLVDEKTQEAFQVKPKVLNENMDWLHETNNEYYLKVYAKYDDNDAYESEIPSLVNSFKIKPEEKYYVEDGMLEKSTSNVPSVEINTVSQKDLQDKIKNQKKETTIVELKPRMPKK